MRLCAATSNQRPDLVHHCANRWDDVIAMFQKLAPTTTLTECHGNQLFREIVIMLMKDKDLILDLGYRVISESALEVLAKRKGMDKEEMRTYLVYKVIVEGSPRLEEDEE